MPLRVRKPIPRLLRLVAVATLAAVLIAVPALAATRPAHRSVRIVAGPPAATETASELMSPTQRRATLHAVRAMQVKNALRRAAVEHQLVWVYWEATYLIGEQKRETGAAAAAHHASTAPSTPTVPRPVVAPTAAPSPAAAAPTGDCWALLAKYFGDVLAWATRVVTRESHCSAATNAREGCDTSGRTNSHALGPFQLCYPLHEATFVAVGCTDPLNLECGMKAARYLYDLEGAGPWGG